MNNLGKPMTVKMAGWMFCRIWAAAGLPTRFANSFHHYPNPQAFFGEVARVLRPGGKLFAATVGKNLNSRLAVFAWQRALGSTSTKPTAATTAKATAEGEGDSGIVFRPVALLNFPTIDDDLADLAVDFWDLAWNDERRRLPQETRLLLSMANALGAGRTRQASRELIKVYAQ